MNRREQFEQEYAEDHDMPIDTFQQYRMGDSYRLPMIAKCWRFYCFGWEASEREIKPFPVAGDDARPVVGS